MAKSKFDDFTYAELQRAVAERNKFEAHVKYAIDRLNAQEVHINAIVMRHNSKQAAPIPSDKIAFIDYNTGTYYSDDDPEYLERWGNEPAEPAKKEKTH